MSDQDKAKNVDDFPDHHQFQESSESSESSTQSSLQEDDLPVKQSSHNNKFHKSKSNKKKTEDPANWSIAQDIPIKSKQSTHQHRPPVVKPNQPFVHDGHAVKYNSSNGIDTDSPLLLGERTIKDKEISRIVLDPKVASIVVGDSAWHNPSKHSLILGDNHKSELSGSLITGESNKTELHSQEGQDLEKAQDIYVGNTILGGHDNTVVNSNNCTIISCENVELENCSNSVVLSLSLEKGSASIKDLKDVTLASNLYSQKLHLGPNDENDAHLDAVAIVNGDVHVNGTMRVTKQLDASSATFDSIVSETATFQNISAAHLVTHSAYVVGESISSYSGSPDKMTNITLTRGDGVQIVYANPISGPIKINLGTNTNSGFETNRIVTIKDVTLEFAAGSSHDIFVSVPQGVKIEHYGIPNGTTGMYGVMSSESGSYVVNSSGGAVTFRYTDPFVPGGLPTWVIESQFVGNARLLQSAGVKFSPADQNTKSRVFK